MDIKGFGFEKIALCTPLISVGDPGFNKDSILKAFSEAEKKSAGIFVCPELCLTGKSCGNLFYSPALLKDALSALYEIKEKTAHSDIAVIVGLPIKKGFRLYNCAVVLQKGKIMGVAAKVSALSDREKPVFSGLDSSLDEIKLFGEKVPFGRIVFKKGETAFAVEIGSDMLSPCPNSIDACLEGANVIINISAESTHLAKYEHIKDSAKDLSRRGCAAYLYCALGAGEGNGEEVFGGEKFGFEAGELISESPRFLNETDIHYIVVDTQKTEERRAKSPFFKNTEENYSLYEEIELLDTPFLDKDFERQVDPLPFVAKNKEERGERAEEALALQSFGLAERLRKIGMKKCILGISGGLDSTLALIVCAEAMDRISLPRENIVGVTMPGFGTSSKTKSNAELLMDELKITKMEISIKDACIKHFEDIGHSADARDITYENAQARERTQILMDLSNKHGALLVGTGDLSEGALGWCTYGGDHMSMFGVNASVPKTFVREIVSRTAEKWGGKIGEILLDIVNTPVSPELLPPDENGDISQKTEEKLGPYELHDFFLYHFIRNSFSADKIFFLAKKAFSGEYGEEEIKKYLEIFIKRFFTSQFKRNCVPDGVKIGSVSLSPKTDFLMPSDISFKNWLPK